ncbi:hypothetical protein TIFTF001_003243 [Ficus carica]|uniref:Uncharacterized protein n=1 Tax=Ficus carica TaxID=3494 RepID=A0AA87ZEY2_FICCA|nr:hypothetical protein TIFTF001_003243 [Ficus carica]
MSDACQILSASQPTSPTPLRINRTAEEAHSPTATPLCFALKPQRKRKRGERNKREKAETYGGGGGGGGGGGDGGGFEREREAKRQRKSCV